MTKKCYFNVPSVGSISRSEAIQEASGRNWHESTHEGLVYFNGGEIYLKISELTDAECRLLSRHLF